MGFLLTLYKMITKSLLKKNMKQLIQTVLTCTVHNKLLLLTMPVINSGEGAPRTLNSAGNHSTHSTVGLLYYLNTS